MCIQHNLLLCRAVTGVVAPMVMARSGTLQPPPGQPLPPQAFLLVEQHLRQVLSTAPVSLAVKLLQEHPSMVADVRQQQQQQLGPAQQGQSKGPTEQKGTSSEALTKQAAAAELAKLAYCSLARSLVSTVVHKRQLADGFERELLSLAAQLVQEVPAGSSRRAGSWGLAASLAAAMAAGAYTAHLGVAPGVAAAGDPHQTVHGSSAVSRSSVTISTTGGSSSSGGTAGASGCSSEGSLATGECAEDCGMCRVAAQTFTTLRCMERGTALLTPPGPAGLAALAEANLPRGTTLQQHLHQQLLALAWRHPVPGVCGNVLCGQLEGVSAVGAVRSRVGTLCGGCRAAWYCCEGCQRAAWGAHTKVCGANC
jgi:hypothetical protein